VTALCWCIDGISLDVGSSHTRRFTLKTEEKKREKTEKAVKPQTMVLFIVGDSPLKACRWVEGRIKTQKGR